MTIGITGHQELGNSETIEWVKAELSKEIERLRPLRGLSCLAKGTDQIFAEMILSRGIDLVAIIPSRDYETTFHNSIDLAKFKLLLEKSIQTTRMKFDKANEEAFFSASQFLVDCSETLVAVWNNKPAKGFGGTADVVAYAKQKNKSVVHINPMTKTTKYYYHGKP